MNTAGGDSFLKTLETKNKKDRVTILCNIFVSLCFAMYSVADPAIGVGRASCLPMPLCRKFGAPLNYTLITVIGIL